MKAWRGTASGLSCALAQLLNFSAGRLTGKADLQQSSMSQTVGSGWCWRCYRQSWALIEICFMRLTGQGRVAVAYAQERQLADCTLQMLLSRQSVSLCRRCCGQQLCGSCLASSRLIIGLRCCCCHGVSESGFAGKPRREPQGDVIAAVGRTS